MRQENRKKGFAMLEVMIIVMIFLVLAASLFASAGAINRRATNRAANNEAYYAALAAVKLMAGEVMNEEQGQAAVALMGNLSDHKTSISITTEDGDTRTVPVTVSSSLKQGGKYLTLTAKATVGEQTENVSMTLQKRTPYVPDYPYGCGIMGNVDFKVNAKIIAGPDVDIFLQGYDEKSMGEEVVEGIVEVGGNLVADGRLQKDGTKIRLRNARVGGMIISNDDVTLENCVVGNSKDKNSLRKGGIYTTGTLSLTNCDVYGNVFTGKFSASGEEDISGSLNYLEWIRNNYTVWDPEGNAFNTSDKAYRRGGVVYADPIKKILDPSMLKDYVPKSEDVFVPQADGLDKNSKMKVIRLKNGDFYTLDELIPADQNGAGKPIEYIIMMEEGSKMVLFGGEWNVYVYGKGTVSVDSDTTIHGGIQAKDIILSNSTLRVYHGEPADPSVKPPSSAAGFKSWVPLDYNMNPSLEDEGL